MLLSKSFISLLIAQFFSALADNAILIALIISLSKIATSSASDTALLQELFVIPFILLAPFAGPVSDFLPKAKAMQIANLIKTFGCLFAFLNFNPFVSYFIIGIGACLYSPAKYGILPQLADEDHIVKANSAIEGSTIAAILIGALLGGYISQINTNYCITLCLICYIIAFILSHFIPTIKSNQSFPSIKLLLKDFYQSIKVFLSDHNTRASLAGSSSFWGSGSALRLALFAWVPFALNQNTASAPTELMGIMAIGTVFGAILAAIFGSPKFIARSFISGLFIGPLVILMALTSTTFIHASIFLFLIGSLGGFFVIPLNAVIQEKGHHSVGSGRALAVQNLFENTLILFCSAAYSLFAKYLNPTYSSAALGLLLFSLCFISFLLWYIRNNKNDK